MKTNKITLKQALKQIKADLIGKDSYRGVTLTYSWMANQFGHISLGFILTMLLYRWYLKCPCIVCKGFWAAVSISIFWLAFEIYNFLGPLLSKSVSKGINLYISSGIKYVFQPSWQNIAFDTFTDLCFFWWGAFFAGILLDYSFIELLIIVSVTVIVIYPIRYWFSVKMYLQNAEIPKQFRLSQWNGVINDDDKKDVLNFLEMTSKRNGYHILIFGGRRIHKSDLGVGILTELSIRNRQCCYYPAMKLFHCFSLTNAQLKEDEQTKLWTWRDADCLLIDDINPGLPIKGEIITTNLFMQLLNVEVDGDKLLNQKNIRDKNVIWILGDENSSEENNSWIQLLKDIKVPDEKIFTIDLGFNFS